ncbi:MAG: hypothetical protein H6869_09015 [Rhodospirillales bacterium]|nr:hypothetical protein [Rhodospirillales bacterium]
MNRDQLKALIEQGSQCNEMLGTCMSANADGGLGAKVGWQAEPLQAVAANTTFTQGGPNMMPS